MRFLNKQVSNTFFSVKTRKRFQVNIDSMY